MREGIDMKLNAQVDTVAAAAVASAARSWYKPKVSRFRLRPYALHHMNRVRYCLEERVPALWLWRRWKRVGDGLKWGEGLLALYQFQAWEGTAAPQTKDSVEALVRLAKEGEL